MFSCLVHRGTPPSIVECTPLSSIRPSKLLYSIPKPRCSCTLLPTQVIFLVGISAIDVQSCSLAPREVVRAVRDGPMTVDYDYDRRFVIRSRVL